MGSNNWYYGCPIRGRKVRTCHSLPSWVQDHGDWLEEHRWLPHFEHYQLLVYGTQRQEVQAAVDDAKVKFAGVDEELTQKILQTAVFAVDGGKHFIGWLQVFIGSSNDNAVAEALAELRWEVDGYPAL